MIVCSCTVVTDQHIERALIEILNEPDAPIPTPGIVFRHLARKMNCCGCAPLVVTKIYELVGKLEREGRICPYACTNAKARLERFSTRSERIVSTSPRELSSCRAEREGELTSA